MEMLKDICTTKDNLKNQLKTHTIGFFDRSTNKIANSACAKQ